MKISKLEKSVPIYDMFNMPRGEIFQSGWHYSVNEFKLYNDLLYILPEDKEIEGGFMEPEILCCRMFLRGKECAHKNISEIRANIFAGRMEDFKDDIKNRQND